MSLSKSCRWVPPSSRRQCRTAGPCWCRADCQCPRFVRSASRTTATRAAQARLRVAQQRARFGRGLLDTREPFLPGRSIVDRIAGDTAPNTVVRKQVAFAPNPKSFARAGLWRWATREKFRNKSPRECLRFHRELSICPRGHSVFHGDEWFNVYCFVYCFAEPGDAAKFPQRFGGETFDPRQRGKGSTGHVGTSRRRKQGSPYLFVKGVSMVGSISQFCALPVRAKSK
jgi:hypothetical protein